MRVFITGACGICGTALAVLPYEKTYFDRREPVDVLANGQYIRGDLNDSGLLKKGIGRCHAVIHLAGCSDPETPWAEVLQNNIQGTYSVFKAAVESGVERIIFASSNHVVGMYEQNNVPRIYELEHGICIENNVPVCPDSYYGVSKAFGENLGRFYAANKGPRFYAIRIGSVRSAEEDNPYAYAENGVKRKLWDRGSKEYETQEKRLKAIWQSRRDFVHMVDLCINFDGPRFDIFYGVSDNPRSWLDVGYAKRVLGYCPQDSGEYWTSPPVVFE